MKFIILLFTACIFTGASAQSLTDVLFTKYNNRKGVSIITDDVSLPKDSTVNVSMSMTIKTLTVENEDEEKTIKRLTKQILRDCNIIFKQKDFSAISIDNDDISLHKVYKHQGGNITEIFDLEQEEDRLTLVVTRITGTTKETKASFKIQTSKGIVENTSF
jgi:hypothetical protein